MTLAWRESTVQELFHQRVEEQPDETAIVFEGDTRESFAEVQQRANIVTKALREHGVDDFDHVGTFMPTHPAFVHLFYGTLQAGARLNPYNLMWGTHELEQVLSKNDPKILVTIDEHRDTDYVGMLHETFPDLEIEDDGSVSCGAVPSLEYVVSYNQEGRTDSEFIDWAEFLEAGRDHDKAHIDELRAKRENTDSQFLIQTSGTSGVSKSVLQTHRSLLGNAHAAIKSMNYKKGEEYMNFSPFYHVSGLMYTITMNSAYIGNTIHLQDHFDPKGALELIDEHEMVGSGGFATFFMGMSEVDGFEDYDLTIRKAVLGMSPSEYHNVVDMLDAPDDELFIANTYGQTEGGPMATLVPAEVRETRLRESNGLQLPGLEVTIKDPESGKEVPPGEGGEICYRGWSQLNGYYNQEKLYQQKLDDDGYWHSGDFGRFEAGYLHFMRRLDDVIKSGGENVSTQEVQEFLVNEFQAFSEARVIGVPDEYWGTRVVAFVRLADDEEMRSTEAWREACKGKIGDYKIPKNFIEHKGEWPVTPTGKLKKNALQEIATEHIDG